MPAPAQDVTVPGRIHWAVVTEGDDPFTEGAYWGLSWSLRLIFGGALGELLTEMTLANVEVHTPNGWVPVA